MPVFEGSRYENAPMFRVADGSGDVRPAIYYMANARPNFAAFSTHRLAEDERLDEIAYRLWGDPQLWWIIANLNPEYLIPDEIPAGTIIRVPLT